jgi:hypothetical protein
MGAILWGALSVWMNLIVSAVFAMDGGVAEAGETRKPGKFDERAERSG